MSYRSLIEQAMQTAARRLRDDEGHLAELWSMPRKALEAAAALGDGVAQGVLKQMSDNIRTTLSLIALVAGLTVSGFFAWEGCTRYTENSNATKLEELKVERELKLKAMQDAQALRERWVDRCIPAAEAERLAPVGSGSATP